MYIITYWEYLISGEVAGLNIRGRGLAVPDAKMRLQRKDKKLLHTQHLPGASRE